MSLIHRPYPKIASSGPQPAVGGEWIATEKIHGAQLAIGVDATQTRVGKRKAWLSARESFFGWQILRQGLCESARAIYEAIGGRGALFVYGELFGGGYPHPHVAPVPGLAPVQTGIWYTPGLGFRVFDLLHVEDDGVPCFLSADQVAAAAEAGGLATPPVLGRGGRAALGALPVRFATRVPHALGLPEIKGNWAEGYVLKPAARMAAADRPSVKRKIPELDERAFDESGALDPNAHLAMRELRELVTHMVNPARLASARSKIGDEPSAVAAEVALDVLVDLVDMLPRQTEHLSPAEEAELTAVAEALALGQLERVR